MWTKILNTLGAWLKVLKFGRLRMDNHLYQINSLKPSARPMQPGLGATEHFSLFRGKLGLISASKDMALEYHFLKEK